MNKFLPFLICMLALFSGCSKDPTYTDHIRYHDADGSHQLHKQQFNVGKMDQTLTLYLSGIGDVKKCTIKATEGEDWITGISTETYEGDFPEIMKVTIAFLRNQDLGARTATISIQGAGTDFYFINAVFTIRQSGTAEP